PPSSSSSSSVTTTATTTVGGSGGGSSNSATGIFSSKALNAQQHQQPLQLSLARDLTTRLWQREAELQTMKELYDAKIRRLTEMLQDAGVSPTEVENNLAVVVEQEETEEAKLNPLFGDHQLSLSAVTSDECHVEQLSITARRRGGGRVSRGIVAASGDEDDTG
ncbi:hypothetical protein BGZ91_010034, partial [Linnemannia elongata]